jgi:hypothetical protein
MITPTTMPMMMPIEPLVSTADAPAEMGDMGGGGMGVSTDQDVRDDADLPRNYSSKRRRQAARVTHPATPRTSLLTGE